MRKTYAFTRFHKNPRKYWVLLYDEPSASLDPEAEWSIRFDYYQLPYEQIY
ncbi:hypothetical protein AG1IA_05585 [Rhizoctonia solani AG-1 IA]|uniref:Uncharacterized protein n=1 Tax=Thanatephorus cucumeris (strain AG1-IA) TaxID=983506 RepID=L8WQW7_THACA|nr:hypothetical protein AG1IA_05585 [Rhizoctonia solani AG-1 IA]